MKTLNEYIKESLFMDPEKIFNNYNVDVIKKWIEEHCSGNFKMVVLKSGEVKVSGGTMIIKGIEEDKIPFIFSKFEGNLSIESCNNIKSLEDWFTTPCIAIGGNLNITNCPKFNSLKGIPPIIEGEFNLVGNRSFKDLGDEQRTVFRNVHLMKNGKKFIEDEIKEHFKVYKHIYCAAIEDDNLINESAINEALNEPHLLKLAKTISNYGKERNSKYHTFGGLFSSYNIAWDEVTGSDVEVYDSYDAKGLTAARKIFSSGIPGMIILVNKNGDYTNCILHTKAFYDLKYGSMLTLTTTDIVNRIKNSDEFVIIRLDELHVDDKRINRAKSREGMVIQGDPNYYKKIAQDNIKRYRKIIAQNAALKSNDVNEVSDAVQRCLNRMMEASNKVAGDPIKYADSVYDLGRIQEIIYQSKVWDSKYSSSDGVLNSYKSFIQYHADLANRKSSYDPKLIQQWKGASKQTCLDAIDKCEYYFKKIGV